MISPSGIIPLPNIPRSASVRSDDRLKRPKNAIPLLLGIHSGRELHSHPSSALFPRLPFCSSWQAWSSSLGLSWQDVPHSSYGSTTFESKPLSIYLFLFLCVGLRPSDIGLASACFQAHLPMAATDQHYETTTFTLRYMAGTVSRARSV